MGARGGQAGFTFLELMLVVGLIALMGGLLLRGIPQSLPFEIRSASRVLSADLHHAGQRAIATGRTHLWVVDLDAQAYRVEYRRDLPDPPAPALVGMERIDLRPPAPQTEQVPVDTRAGDWRYLDEGEVAIARVRVGDREWTEGVTAIGFAPDGGADPAEIWLEDGSGRAVRIRVYAFTGEVRVDEEPDA